MSTRYSVKAVCMLNKAKSKVQGELWEGDVRVATYKFDQHEYPQYNIKFGSSQAKARFEDFSGSLSMGETIEAIGGLGH